MKLGKNDLGSSSMLPQHNQLLHQTTAIRSALVLMGYAPETWSMLDETTLKAAARMAEAAAAAAAAVLQQQGSNSSQGISSASPGIGSGNSSGSGSGEGKETADANVKAPSPPPSAAVLSAAAFPRWDSRDRKLTGGLNLVCPVRQGGHRGSGF